MVNSLTLHTTQAALVREPADSLTAWLADANPGQTAESCGLKMPGENLQCLPGLHLPQSHIVHNRSHVDDELLDKLPRVGSVSNIFERLRHGSRKALSLEEQHADPLRKQQSIGNTDVLTATSQVLPGSSSCLLHPALQRSDQNRDRHRWRKEPLPEMSGLAVLRWQDG